MGSLDTICEDRGVGVSQGFSLRRVHSVEGHSFLPCPVSHQRPRSCVDCVARPGRPSPGVSGPFVPLSATADLQMAKGFISCSNALRLFAPQC